MTATLPQSAFLQRLLASLGLTLSLALGLAVAVNQAKADLVSPNITERDDMSEPVAPDTSYFGTGVGGRHSEASVLRFEGERLCDDGKYEQAIEKLDRAVKLDPGDGTTHLLYARAMSGRLKNQLRKTGTINEHDLAIVIREWKMLSWHDADAIDQAEARSELKTLAKVQKQLRKGEIAPEANRLAAHFHSL